MQELFKLFWDIALWRREPRDVPASAFLLALLGIAYAVFSALQSWLAYGPEGAWLRGVVDLAFTAAVFYVALAIPRRTNRYVQTLTAVLGTSVLISLPLVAILLVAGPDASGAFGVLLALATLPLVVWYLFVVGHIVRSALDAPLVVGMAVSLTYFLLSYTVLVRLVPTGAAG